MGYVIVFAFWKCQEENNISWHIALECIVVSNAFSNEEQMIRHYWRLVIELDHVSSFVLGAIPRAQYWIIWMNFHWVAAFSIMIQFSARFWLWLINFYGIGGRAILPLNAFSCWHIVKEWRRTWGRLQQFRQGWSYFPHFPFLLPCLMQVNLFCEVKQIFPFKWVRLLQEQGKIQVRRFM